jgi:hypothetical protein
MAGFLGFAPIYLNGLLALFFIFVLPGLVLVRAFSPSSRIRVRKRGFRDFLDG